MTIKIPATGMTGTDKNMKTFKTKVVSIYL